MSDLSSVADIDLPALAEHPLDESVAYDGPPGCGKTTTALGRAALIIDSDTLPYELADVTFVTYRRSLAEDAVQTAADIGVVPEAAAVDLETRLESDARYWATVHGVVVRAMDEQVEIVTEQDKRVFCRDVLGVEYDAAAPWRDATGELIMQAIMWCKRNLIDPADPSAPVDEAPQYDDLQERWGGELSAAARAWERFKAAGGTLPDDEDADLIDYPDLLLRAVEKPIVPPTSVLVVDEYHDAYPALAAVVETWMDRHDVTIVAADKRQVINSYRGADPEFFEQLNLPVINLEESRRVPREHYAAALRVLHGAHDLPSVRPAGSGDLVEVTCDEPIRSKSSEEWQVPSPETRGSPGWVHEQMVGRADDGDEIMHLTRTRRQASAVCAALDAAGVPYRSQGDEMPGWGGVGNVRRAVYNVMSAAAPSDVPHGEGRVDAESVEISSDAGLRAVAAAPIDYVRPTNEVVRAVRSDLDADDEDFDPGYIGDLANLDALVTPGFWQALEDPAALREWDLDEQDAEAVVRALRRRGAGDQIRRSDVYGLPVVRTVHASKGTEAEHVAVYTGATEQINDAVEASDRERANEHRVWYVALTRASESLYVVHDAVAEMQEISEDGPEVRGVAEAARDVTGTPVRGD